MAVSGERETIDREIGKPEKDEKRSRGNLKSSYMKFLLRVKDRPMKVTVPSKITVDSTDIITEIPRIAEPNVDEVE